jgi:hypothetical protein
MVSSKIPLKSTKNSPFGNSDNSALAVINKKIPRTMNYQTQIQAFFGLFGLLLAICNNYDQLTMQLWFMPERSIFSRWQTPALCRIFGQRIEGSSLRHRLGVSLARVGRGLHVMICFSHSGLQRQQL